MGPRNDTEYGQLSGYPSCCIRWFRIRFWLMQHTPYWPLMRKYMQWFGKKFGFRHVLCPGHQALAMLRVYKPRYFTCGECGWKQHGQGPCRIEHLHFGWRFENILDTHRHFAANGWKYKGGGEIGKRIRRSLQ